MDPGDRARRTTIIREARRGQRRTAELVAALGDPRLQRYLAEVDRRWPNLADSERLRVARILTSAAGTGGWAGVTALLGGQA